MTNKFVSDDEFVEVWNECGGSPQKTSEKLGLSERRVYERRNTLRARGITLKRFEKKEQPRHNWAYRRLNEIVFENGTVVVYSDPHFWPGLGATPAYQALITLCSELKPVAIVANGDLIDGAKISRFPRPGWANQPSVSDELGELQLRQAEIRKAAPKAKHFRTIGNHCLRFDRYLASQADQFEGLGGFRLADHLPDWPESYTVRINDTYIQHRVKGGVHAGWNNALHAGVSICTGHLHQIGAKPIRGLRDAHVWGIETGTLADTPGDLSEYGEGPFEYVEDSPTHWASGFAVLTYASGRLLPPEFCMVHLGAAYFRGKKVT